MDATRTEQLNAGKWAAAFMVILHEGEQSGAANCGEYNADG